eukprot:gene28052-31154_t
MDSMNGDTAGKRKAITELLFFSSAGDLHRCKKLYAAHDIKTDLINFAMQLGDPATADYDKRTPLHLASAEGCHSVVAWLVSSGSNVNAVDRFKRTPLEDAVRGDHGEVAALLIDHGGKVIGKQGDLVELADSPLSGNVRIFTEYDPDWEIDPSQLRMHEVIGEGEFGIVHKASWYGTLVAVKILKDTSSVAIGDFRTELNVLQKVHHTHSVQFLGAVTKTQPFMIVTEFMTGGSLTDMFRQQRFPALWRGVEMALDMARGLAYLHNRSPHRVEPPPQEHWEKEEEIGEGKEGATTDDRKRAAYPVAFEGAVIHRDLKPANLMLGGHKTYNAYHKLLMSKEVGGLKLADFGLSKSLKLGKKKNRRTSLDSVDGSSRPSKTPLTKLKATGTDAVHTDSFKLTGETGSYRYMAPEVFRHEPYNNKVDVYGFAMICYQLFEGSLPFSRFAPVDAAQAASLLGKRPEWSSRPKNGEQLRQLIARCWAEKHEDRPEFDDIIVELEAMAEVLTENL